MISLHSCAGRRYTVCSLRRDQHDDVSMSYGKVATRINTHNRARMIILGDNPYDAVACTLLSRLCCSMIVYLELLVSICACLRLRYRYALCCLNHVLSSAFVDLAKAHCGVVPRHSKSPEEDIANGMGALAAASESAYPTGFSARPGASS